MQSALPDLSAKERKLLELLQEDLPLDVMPWDTVGRAAGFSGAEVLAKLALWREQGLIRKIGPSVNPRALGWFSSLCAAKVSEDMIPAFQQYVNTLDAVTHCYLRDNGQFNVWFTIIAPDEAAVWALAEELRRRFGLAAVKSFPATEVFKIKAVFDLGGAD